LYGRRGGDAHRWVSVAAEVEGKKLFVFRRDD
jgi:hypothetical protein